MLNTFKIFLIIIIKIKAFLSYAYVIDFISRKFMYVKTNLIRILYRKSLYELLIETDIYSSFSMTLMVLVHVFLGGCGE